MSKINVIFEDYEPDSSESIKQKNRVSNYQQVSTIKEQLSKLLDMGLSFKVKLRGLEIANEKSSISLQPDRFIVDGNSYSYTGIYIELT